MNVLVVFAHPHRESFCGALLDEVVVGVREAGCDCRVRDLYAIAFDPRLSADEFERERRYGNGAAVSATVREEQEHVEWADAIVFVCPLWWSDVPAVLKGWFDRVWAKGFAWSYSGSARLKKHGPTRACLIISAGASYEKLEADGVVRALQTVTLGDRLRNVGFSQAELVLLTDMDIADESLVSQHLIRARTTATALASPSDSMTERHDDRT